MPPGELKVLLRRAAMILGNEDSGSQIDSFVEEALDGVAAERQVSKPKLLGSIVTQWLIVNSHLPLYKMEENSSLSGAS